MIWESEDGLVESVTYAELSAEVNRLANALLELGVRRATRSASSCRCRSRSSPGSTRSPRSGRSSSRSSRDSPRPAVAARLADAGAVALLTADAVPRRGKPVAMKAIADQAVAEVPSVRSLVVWSRLGTDPPMQAGARPPLGRAGRPPEPGALGTRARSRDADDGDLHVRDDGAAQGRRARPRRIPGQDRRGVRVPARRRHRRPLHVGDRHGLDHGAPSRWSAPVRWARRS